MTLRRKAIAAQVLDEYSKLAQRKSGARDTLSRTHVAGGRNDYAAAIQRANGADTSQIGDGSCRQIMSCSMFRNRGVICVKPALPRSALFR